MSRPLVRVALLSSLGCAALCASLLAAAPPALAAPPDASAPGAVPGGARGLHAGRGGRAFERVGSRRGRRAHRRGAARLARVLDLTPEQRASFREARTAAATLRQETRAKVRDVLRAAREGERTPESREARRAEVREKVRAILEGARAKVAPQAKQLAGLLTPAQRERLTARATAHAERKGETLDAAALEARLEARIARALLAGPRGHARGGRRAR